MEHPAPGQPRREQEPSCADGQEWTAGACCTSVCHRSTTTQDIWRFLKWKGHLCYVEEVRETIFRFCRKTKIKITCSAKFAPRRTGKRGGIPPLLRGPTWDKFCGTRNFDTFFAEQGTLCNHMIQCRSTFIY